MAMKLKPLGPHQVYVSGLSAELAKAYRDTPGAVNQHAIQAIFEPINDSQVVLLSWAFGGLNATSRNDVKIFDTESQELIPAWE
jgi:hypothetical protein